MTSLVLFDFDGTITKDDTLIKFIRFAVGDFKFAIGISKLLPMFIAYKLKLIPNYKAKELMLSYFFKNIKEDEFKKIAYNYSINQIDYIVRKKAKEKIEWHKKQGHKVVIVSASIECWLKPWCEKYDIELIATKLDFENNIFTGKLLTKNCYGIEKVNRVKKAFNISKYNYIYAYGDSKGDKELLNIANKSYYKAF